MQRARTGRLEWLALVIVACTPGFASGQAGVTGIVRTERSVIGGVTVRIARASGDSGVFREAITDSAGRFAFSRVPSGAWSVAARMLGYRVTTRSVLVRDTTAFLELTLLPSSTALDTVAVSASIVGDARYGPNSRMRAFYDRKALGRGTFFDRTHIDESGRTTLADLLRTVGGAKVTRGNDGSVTVLFARCIGQTVRSPMSQHNSSTQLFLNGTRVQDVATELGLLRLSDIEAVEVYRGPTELPVEAVGNGCAAIYVWTRLGR